MRLWKLPRDLQSRKWNPWMSDFKVVARRWPSVIYDDISLQCCIHPFSPNFPIQHAKIPVKVRYGDLDRLSRNIVDRVTFSQLCCFRQPDPCTFQVVYSHSTCLPYTGETDSSLLCYLDNPPVVAGVMEATNTICERSPDCSPTVIGWTRLAGRGTLCTTSARSFNFIRLQD